MMKNLININCGRKTIIYVTKVLVRNIEGKNIHLFFAFSIQCHIYKKNTSKLYCYMETVLYESTLF